MPNAEETQRLKNEEYCDRSGCRKIVVAIFIIILFWVAVGAIYLFT